MYDFIGFLTLAFFQVEWQHLRIFLRFYSISDAEHERTLAELGSSKQQLSALRGETPASSDSCVLCWQAMKEFVCFPCAHVCLCESCAASLRSRADNNPADVVRCPYPKCNKKVSNIARVYR